MAVAALDVRKVGAVWLAGCRKDAKVHVVGGTAASRGSSAWDYEAKVWGRGGAGEEVAVEVLAHGDMKEASPTGSNALKQKQ